MELYSERRYTQVWAKLTRVWSWIPVKTYARKCSSILLFVISVSFPSFCRFRLILLRMKIQDVLSRASYFRHDQKENWQIFHHGHYFLKIWIKIWRIRNSMRRSPVLRLRSFSYHLSDRFDMEVSHTKETRFIFNFFFLMFVSGNFLEILPELLL